MLGQLQAHMGTTADVLQPLLRLQTPDRPVISAGTPSSGAMGGANPVQRSSSLMVTSGSVYNTPFDSEDDGRAGAEDDRRGPAAVGQAGASVNVDAAADDDDDVEDRTAPPAEANDQADAAYRQAGPASFFLNTGRHFADVARSDTKGGINTAQFLEACRYAA
jgi:hypothetical protein